MTEKRSLVWGLVNGRKEAQLFYGDCSSSGGKSLINDQFPGRNLICIIPLDSGDPTSDLRTLMERNPCPELKEEDTC